MKTNIEEKSLKEEIDIKWTPKRQSEEKESIVLSKPMKKISLKDFKIVRV